MFRPGQHVKLVRHPWHANPENDGQPIPATCPLQLGDRFTILHSCKDAVKLLRHDGLGEDFLLKYYVEEIKYDAEPKGQPRAHLDTLRALGQVLKMMSCKMQRWKK